MDSINTITTMGNTCIKPTVPNATSNDNHFFHEIQQNIQNGISINPPELSLNNISADSFAKFELSGLTLKCKVLHIYDGDTCDVGFKLFGVPLQRRLRLRWINTEEIRQSTKLADEVREQRKQRAIDAKYRLVEMLTGTKPKDDDDCKSVINNTTKEIWVKFCNDDNFSRSVSEIYLDSKLTTSVHELMIKEGHSELFDKYESAADIVDIKLQLKLE